MSKYWVIVGSLNPLLTTLQFTTSPPSLSFVSQYTSGTSPVWLANSPKYPTTIYATDRIDPGSINSLTLNLTTGGLTRLANMSTQGGGPNHLGFISNGTALGATNYDTGSVFIVNLDATGTGEFTSHTTLVPFQGSGPLPNQLSPHPHQVGFIPKSWSLRIELTC